MRPLLLLLVAVALAGCDTFLGTKCLLGRAGCHLPGKWRLVDIDGTPHTGSLDVSGGQWDRDGYLDLPTGLARPLRLQGPYAGDYNNEPDSPTHFGLDVTADTVVANARRVELDGDVDMADDEKSFVLTLWNVQAGDDHSSTAQLPLPLLKRGARLTFRRVGS